MCRTRVENPCHETRTRPITSQPGVDLDDVRLMEILQDLCAIPTAPFAEDRVMTYVEQFARDRRGLRLSRDRWGNRLIELRGSKNSSRTPRLVLVAHADHPGFVARRMINPDTLLADFRGGVMAEYVRGAKVRFFDGERNIRGVVTTTEQRGKSPVPHRTTVRVDAPVAPGSIGMFDLPPARVRGHKFHARVCDDLAGLAAALTALDELHRARPHPRASVALLVTRAEEVGFIGAVAAAKDASLLRKSDLVISIECSSVQPVAPQGNGVILRVGDRTSVFNSGLMYFLNERARELAKRDKSFAFQRALMPGGSCEGTVFDAWGYPTGGVCLPLVNYHNMDRATKRLAPEVIDLRDWRSMVKLFVAVARRVHEFQPGLPTLRRRIDEQFQRLRGLLGSSNEK
jgi:endoglucanase